MVNSFTCLHARHKTKVQQIGVQMGKDFKPPEGQISFNYRDLNKKLTFILDTNLTQGHLPSQLFVFLTPSQRKKNPTLPFLCTSVCLQALIYLSWPFLLSFRTK